MQRSYKWYYYSGFATVFFDDLCILFKRQCSPSHTENVIRKECTLILETDHELDFCVYSINDSDKSFCLPLS